MDKYVKRVLTCILIGVFSFIMFGVSAPAFADDVNYSYTAFDFAVETTEHNPDLTPFKGSFNLTVTNNTSQAWGDFHFYLFDIGYSSNVVFDVTTPNEPTSSQTGLSWNVYNNSKNLDLFFYSNPIGVGQTATFSVYTDNTDNMQPFGMAMYPSLVPEPVSSTLFIAGALALGFRRFKKKMKV